MNLSRLLVLGSLARLGPRHGHQIRRDAEQTNVSSWGGVSVGALYRELREMEGEELIVAVRTETEGRRPARTIYKISAEGRRELRILREQALTELRPGPDAVAVALLFGGLGEGDAAIGLLRVRSEALQRELTGIAAERTHLTEAGHLGPVDIAVFRRGEHLRAAEIAWIAETIESLGTSKS
jgi:DNA-binding PadR family transcriptional regulator